MELLEQAEAARLLGVSVSTICFWDRIGRLHPVIHDRQGRPLYHKARVEGLARQSQQDIAQGEHSNEQPLA
jgi:DNA-binding transcriptional MerR regulator